MYVCVCNVLTDRDVAAALDAGARTAVCVYRYHDCRPQCGRCLAMVRDTVARRSSDDPQTVPPLMAAE